MDFRAGLILVCMLFARASCQPVRNKTDGALTSTIETMEEEIKKALHHLSAPGLIPNISCSTLNMMKQLPLQQQPLTVHHITTFRCYMQKFSALIHEVSKELEASVQFMQDVERLLTDRVVPESCSLPDFKEELDTLIHANCFLKLLQKRLSSSEL